MAKQMRPTIVGLAGPADVRAIAGCRDTLMKALEHGSDIHVDLSALTDVDLTLVQLITSARRFAAATGKALALKVPAGDALRSILERGGFLGSAQDREFWLHDTGAC